MSGELLFIDFEASGLHAASYPIEVGWCDLGLLPLGVLIQPAPHWSEWDWSLESQRIHGITRAECVNRGLDVVRTSHVLNTEWRGAVLISDAPGFDGAWLARLFDAAQVEPLFSLRLENGMKAIRDAVDNVHGDLMEIEQRLSKVVPRPHRAAADAKYLAALWRAAHEEDFLDRLEAGDKA